MIMGSEGIDVLGEVVRLALPFAVSDMLGGGMSRVQTRVSNFCGKR